MKNAGVWVGFVLLLFSGTMFFSSLSLDYHGSIGPGPGLFPLWLSGLLIVLTVLYIIESFIKNEVRVSDILPKGKALRRVLLFVGSFLFFLLIVPFTGFCVAGIAMLSIMFLQAYKWYVGMAISTVITLFFFVVFAVLLKIPLPVNSFGW